MDINQLRSVVMYNGYSNDELNSLIEAIRFARAQLTRQIKRSICVGDNVNFTDSKKGVNYTGSVMKIAVKYVTVKTVKGLYRVPANMLTVV